MEEHEMVWRARAECEGLNHEQIIAALAAEANSAGYEPDDLNEGGVPNVYLRGRYAIEEGQPDRWLEDGFVMFVKRAERGS